METPRIFSISAFVMPSGKFRTELMTVPLRNTLATRKLPPLMKASPRIPFFVNQKPSTIITAKTAILISRACITISPKTKIVSF